MSDLETIANGHAQLALMGAAILASVVFVRILAFGLLRRLMKTPHRRTNASKDRPKTPLARRHKALNARTNHIEQDHRLTADQREKLRKGQAIALKPNFRSGLLIDHMVPDRTCHTGGPQTGTPLERMFGDLRVCRSGRAIAALLEEPRYQGAHSGMVLGRLLRRLVEVGAQRKDVLQALYRCRLIAGPPVPEQRRFINLVSAPPDQANEVRWHHVSQTCIWTRPIQPRRMRLLPVSRLNYRRGVIVYFDAEDRLVGWQITGKLRPLDVNITDT